VWGEEAGFGGVGGYASTSDRGGRVFAELVGGEVVLGVGAGLEDVAVDDEAGALGELVVEALRGFVGLVGLPVDA